MVDKDLLEQIRSFFHAYKPERNRILQENFTKTLNELASRNIYGSITGNRISELYANELISRVNIAWNSSQRLFDQRDISLSKDDADEIREEIKRLINSELGMLSNDFQSKMNTMRLSEFKKEIDHSLGAARNQEISKINADLNIYIKPNTTDNYQFDKILLEAVQEDLIIRIVEAARNTLIEHRVKFLVAQSFEGDTLVHPSIPENRNQIYFGDVEALGREGLLAIGYGSHGTPSFDVTPFGFKYYEYLKKRMGQSGERVETTIKKYLDTHIFQQKYPESYKKWISAEQALWAVDNSEQGTSIGHLCREAVQEFAEVLIKENQPPDAPKDKTKTVARLKAIINAKSDDLGKTEKPFLEALLEYWGTLIDLIQRQEHGGQKEGKTLIWEDARKVVFHTMIVMFEIDKAL